MSPRHIRGRGHIGDTLTCSLLFLERHPVRPCSCSLLKFRLAARPTIWSFLDKQDKRKAVSNRRAWACSLAPSKLAVPPNCMYAVMPLSSRKWSALVQSTRLLRDKLE